MYVRLLYGFQDLFAQLRLTNILKPALAGLGIGLAGVFLPQIYGVGYPTIDESWREKSRVFGSCSCCWLRKSS